MAEEIKVVLEADASQLTGEFKKARAAAEAFSNKTLPLTTAELNRVYLEQQRVTKALVEGQKGVKNYGQGMLQFAQFADDAQYGLRGVMNNIPGLVMGLGGGAGLAGALSVALLAGSKLLPVLKDIFAPGEDPEALKAFADQLANLRKKSEELAAVRGAASAREFVARLGEEEAGIVRQNQALAMSIELLKARAVAAGNVAAAQNQFELARIASDPSLSPEEKSRQSLQVQNRQARDQAQARLAEINARVSGSARAAEEKAAAVERARADADRLRAQIASEESQRQALLRRVNAANLAEASIPGAQAAVDNFKTPGGLTGSVQERAAAALAARQKLVDNVERLKSEALGGDAARREFAAVEASLDEQRKALDALVSRGAALADEARRAAEARDFSRSAAEAEAKSLQEIYRIEKARRALEGKVNPTAPGPLNDMEALLRDLPRLQNEAAASAVKAEAKVAANRKQAAAAEGRELLANAASRSRGFQSRIQGAGGISPASTWGGVGAAGRIGGGLGASFRGGVAAAGMPGLGPGYRVHRGLGSHFEEVERRRVKPVAPDGSALKLLERIAESSGETSKALKALGIL